jgi:hypothetical protein
LPSAALRVIRQSSPHERHGWVAQTTDMVKGLRDTLRTVGTR